MLLVLTVISTTVALVMSIVAWRATTAERRRVARIAALAAEIHASPAAVAAPPPIVRATPAPIDLDLRQDQTDPDANAGAADARDLFAAAVEPAGRSRYAVALAGAGFVLATVAAVGIVFSGESATAPRAAAASRADAPATPAAPLELVALAHERSGDTLTVRGVVRNPQGGQEMDRLTAVVFLFDRDGGFQASGRAAVESPRLIPGGESTFVVTIPGTGDVSRYRVSFRSDDHIVAHVDRRGRS